MLRPWSSLCCSILTRACAETSLPGSTSMRIPAVVRQMRAIMPEVMNLAPEARLPLVEQAVPALRQMSPAQMREFLNASEGAR